MSPVWTWNSAQNARSQSWKKVASTDTHLISNLLTSGRTVPEHKTWWTVLLRHKTSNALIIKLRSGLNFHEYDACRIHIGTYPRWSSWCHSSSANFRVFELSFSFSAMTGNTFSQSFKCANCSSTDESTNQISVLFRTLDSLLGGSNFYAKLIILNRHKQILRSYPKIYQKMLRVPASAIAVLILRNWVAKLHCPLFSFTPSNWSRASPKAVKFLTIYWNFKVFHYFARELQLSLLGKCEYISHTQCKLRAHH